MQRHISFLVFNFLIFNKNYWTNKILFQILIMRVSSGSQSPALITAADLAPFAEPLLQGLFGAFELPASAENEYVMKCVMRSFSTLQENVIPYLATLLPVLTQKLQLAAKNPTKPHYNHYLVSYPK
jgi:hypothetical protein